MSEMDAGKIGQVAAAVRALGLDGELVLLIAITHDGKNLDGYAAANLREGNVAGYAALKLLLRKKIITVAQVLNVLKEERAG